MNPLFGLLGLPGPKNLISAPQVASIAIDICCKPLPSAVLENPAGEIDAYSMHLTEANAVVNRQILVNIVQEIT